MRHAEARVGDLRHVAVLLPRLVGHVGDGVMGLRVRGGGVDRIIPVGGLLFLLVIAALLLFLLLVVPVLGSGGKDFVGVGVVVLVVALRSHGGLGGKFGTVSRRVDADLAFFFGMLGFSTTIHIVVILGLEGRVHGGQRVGDGVEGNVGAGHSFLAAVLGDVIRVGL